MVDNNIIKWSIEKKRDDSIMVEVNQKEGWENEL